MPEQFDLFTPPQDEIQTPPKPSRGPRILVFDLETQKSVDDVGGWGNVHLMKMAVGVVWDSVDQKYYTYREQDAEQLVDKLKTADLVVGFNVIGFDYSVLQPYASFDLQEIPTFDLLLDVKKKLGFRLSLNHLAQQTLNVKKSADGLISLQWFKEGKIDRIIEYCTKDVEITRDLFLFGETHGYICYLTKSGVSQQLEVDWKIDKLV
ncbi:MAG: DEAD/DEAH box helicase [Nitrospinaceae bacterium]|nr:DEAD/DEAH box helicase [Nitrospinaceae bacterium]NIR57723.1 DEAD/DEAH box helicase [Nitrospinaceae bacterium]NIS88183.1 DEAD/DEAH box helicase [Nitrospinaceae bacterium]NIT85065.1 DEAD/DEAH box helicase [Nitrospinaceae bacterium]NIU47223.1 DEAD/DEAH box helicase [Nitrospinaceae bacterium]